MADLCEPLADTDTDTDTGAGRPAHLVHVFPSFGIGGVPLRIATVMNRLGRRYRHTVVALDGNLDAAAHVGSDVAAGYRSVALPRYSLPKALARIAAELKDLGPDLLLTYNWGAVEWALAAMLTRRGAHLHLESGFGLEEAEGLKLRRALFRRLALARTDAVVVPSHTLAAIARQSWRIPPGRIVHIANGIDCRRFAAPPNPELRARLLGGDEAGVVVGTVAPLRPEKNVGRLLRVFRDLPTAVPTRLLIVGDGSERAGLEAEAAALGIADRVIFAGYVAEVERVLGLIDVFVLTSDTEQMPNALLQAMANGRAIASTDVGDVRRILPAEAGRFVVGKTDERALARVVADLVETPALRTAAAEANRCHVVAHHALDGMIATYDALFARVLAGRRA